MSRNRDIFAVLFLPRRLWHRFRELDGFIVSQCRSSNLRPRIALATRRWRSTARRTSQPCSGRSATSRTL